MPHAPRARRAPPVVGTLALLALLGTPARPADGQLTIDRNAGSARASATFFGVSLPPRMDEATFGPFGGVAVAEVGGGGRVRAAQTGSGLNAVTAGGRFGDIPGFVLRAETAIEVRVRNAARVAPEPLLFSYLINGGELRLLSPTGRFEGLEATVGVSIFTIAPGFGGFLWEWGVTLRGTGGTAVADVHGFAPIFDVHDPLGLGVPTLGPITVAGGEAVLPIAPFTAAADLGSLAAGASAVLTYSMYGAVSGPGLNLTGGEATIGDPFDLAGAPGSAISFAGVALEPVPSVVPEPGTATLAALGLGLLAARRRRAVRAPTPPAPATTAPPSPPRRA